jgi:excisionase family DNA binding protein
MPAAAAAIRSQRRHPGLNEAAEIAGVHKRTMRRWIAEGRIRAYRIGPRLIKVDIDDLEALLQPIGAR